jgi:hypothetical protein
MNSSDDDEKKPEIVRFPQSRVRPAGGREPLRELGYSELVQRLEFSKDHATGHWCSRCQGIWYGALLEVACPACGNRRG